jgi:hypothetical protein
LPDDDEHVLFLFGGMIDNCYGIAYSLTEEPPSQNCCGDLITWKRIKGNWYKWTTT